MRIIALSRANAFFCYDGLGLNLFFTKYSNIPHAKVDQQKFEDADAHDAPLKDVFPYQVCHVWSQLHYGGIQRVCNTANVCWDNAESWVEGLPPPYRGWTYKDGKGNEVWSMEAGTVVAFVKALVASRLPNRVCASQVAEWLPDLDCRAVMDLMANEYCLCTCLSVLLSAAAENLGQWLRSVLQAVIESVFLVSCSY